MRAKDQLCIIFWGWVKSTRLSISAGPEHTGAALGCLNAIMATPCRPGTLVHSLKSDINGRWRAPLAITRLGCLNTTWTVNLGIKNIIS